MRTVAVRSVISLATTVILLAHDNGTFVGTPMSQHPHVQLIENFYRAFQRLDPEAMAACYHPEVSFSDPVFRALHGPRAGMMWSMLCERGKTFTLEYSDLWADEQTGRAHWIARYDFTATGRKVVNQVDARFEFKDSKIYTHRDTFDLWKWAGMALGAKGKLLGWLPPVQGAIRSMAMKGLAEYERARRTGH